MRPIVQPSVTTLRPIRRTKPSRAVTAVALVMALGLPFVGISADEASAGYCANYTWRTTDSYSSTWQSVYASWGGQSVTYGSPCSDVNVTQTNRVDVGPDIVEARSAYFSPSQSKWIHGSAGWVHSPKNVQIQTITNLPQTGIAIKTGSNRVSTIQEIGT